MTPEQEEAVRRALAATARGEVGDAEGAVPAEVAARLDDRLAELVAERSEQAAARPASGHRPPGGHRRWPRTLAVAAAAVVVAAGGGTAVVRSLAGSGSASSSSASSTDSAAAPATTAGPAGSAAGATPRTLPGTAGGSFPAGAPDLRTATLRRDVQRAAASVASPGHGTHLGPGAAGGLAGGCRVPPLGPGLRAVAVRLDGSPATLVLPRAAGRGVARVYRCGHPATPEATATVVVR